MKTAWFALIAALLLFPSAAGAQYSQTVGARVPAKTAHGTTMKKNAPVIHMSAANQKKSTHATKLKKPN